MKNFSIEDKLEVIEFFLTQWRPARSSDISGERDTYLILKEVARDIRARMPGVPSRSRDTLQRAIDRATAAKTGVPGTGYEGRTMFALAQVVIGEWAVIRQALDQFKEEAKSD